MSSRAPLLPETHSHAETPSPPRLEYPSSRDSWRRAGVLLKRETKVQESRNKVAAIHRLLPEVVQLTAQFLRTIRNGMVLQMRWLAALAPLRISMAAYLRPNTDTVALSPLRLNSRFHGPVPFAHSSCRPRALTRRLFQSEAEYQSKPKPRAPTTPPSTPTALRPLAQGWPRNEAYPGSTS